MTASNPSRGQVERNLTQRIQVLYHQEMGHRPDKVICQFFDEKIAIVLYNVVTRSEQFLFTNNREDVAKNLRLELDEAIKPQLRELIEEVAGVSVTTILCDTDLKSGFCGIIVVLDGLPSVRDLQSIPKVKKEKLINLDSD